MRLPCAYYEPTMSREAQTKPPCINHAQAKRCSKDTMRRLHGKRNVEQNAKRALHKKKGDILCSNYAQAKRHSMDTMRRLHGKRNYQLCVKKR